MRIPDSLVEKLLKDTGKFTAEQLIAVRTQEAHEKKPLQDLVIKNSMLSEKDLAKLYANEIEVPFIELHAKDIPRDALKNLPERIARQYNAVVFDVTKDGTISLALADPNDIRALNFLHKQLGNNLEIYITTDTIIQAVLDQYRGTVSSELTKVVFGDDPTEPEYIPENDVAEDSLIAQTVNLIIEYGVEVSASDIHIEPREGFVVVRYRVDGILQEANKLPRKMLGALVSRIKILSNMKIDEHRTPQDGRFKVEVSGLTYALSVSTLPIIDGEKIVIKILNESTKSATLEELGFWGTALRDLHHAIVQPHGMVVVTGPAGSGKSTTLFSVLSMLNTPNVNISTVEDPVEYRVPGTNQTQVNPVAGMTFSDGLRALLRQDPNIIMVGEIRDGETADLSVQAALTGHLVFTTLHTTNAASCLPRLLNMGVEPFLIASTVRVVVAQRLVRRLCMECRQPFVPDNVLLTRLTKTFHLDEAGIIKRLNEFEAAAITDGIGVSKTDSSTNELSTTEKGISRLFKAREEGCENCNHTGFKGRVGIYEVLNNSEAIQKMIVTNATSEAIQTKAVDLGMLPMQLDGFIKALRGESTIEEVLRVTSSD